jgi:poly-D-alanine transfer protein DltD
LTNEVLRNGVPHQVTTSLVTNNAVLPQNVFTTEEAPSLDDSANSSIAPDSSTLQNSGAFEQTSNFPTPKAAQDYPITQDTLQANDALTATKTHIRDNIQALKNLARSDNLQNVGADKFSKNIQETKLYLEKKSVKSNRQLISKTTFERAAPNLASHSSETPSNLSSDELNSQATQSEKRDQLQREKQLSLEDNAFQIRVKRLKNQVRDVDSTLHNLDPDK